MEAIIIGISAIAILRGISRSEQTYQPPLLGSTGESCTVLLLDGCPLIFGRWPRTQEGGIMQTEIGAAPLVLGALAAFVSGLLACKWMIALVKRSQLKYFSFYCFLVGVIAMGYALLM